MGVSRSQPKSTLHGAHTEAEPAAALKSERQQALDEAWRAVDALGGVADTHFDRDIGYSDAITAALGEIEKLGGKWS